VNIARRRGPAGLACCIAALSFFGCAGTWVSRKPLPELDSRTLLRQLETHAGRLETFQGRGVFTAVSEEGGIRGSIRIAAKRPDSMWVKLEGPMGIDLITARITGGKVAYFSPWMKNTLSDSAGLPDFGLLFPAGLDSAEVLSSLYGMPFPQAGTADSLRSVERERRRYVLHLGRGESVWIEPKGPVVTQWEKRDDFGSLVWSYEAESFANREGIRIPKKIRFRSGEDGELVLYYEEMKANQRLRKGWCDVRTPKGASVSEL
jgi:hypothetical protein